MEARQQVIERFRSSLKVGDQTHCGMVIEIKPPIIKVQTDVEGDKWFRPQQLFPPGKAGCFFRNHQYVETW